MNYNRLLILLSLVIPEILGGLFSLSSLKGNGSKTTLNDKGPFGVYVSASADDTNLLSQIFLVVDGKSQISVNDLRLHNRSQDSGEIQAYTVTSQAYLTTNLSSTQLQTLDGVIYCSTPSQLRNKNFHVVDVSVVQYFNVDANATTRTTLFLNTMRWRNYSPHNLLSTYISNWEQDENTRVFIYAGLPSDSMEPERTQIFSNPVYANNTYLYFSTVETFALTGLFYMKSTGSVNFRIEPNNAYELSFQTTAYTSTGLYSFKSETGCAYLLKRNTTFSGWSGGNVIGDAPSGAQLSVNVTSFNLLAYQTKIAINQTMTSWSFPVIGAGSQIIANGTQGAQWYYQYYEIQGPIITTSTTPRVTSPPSRISSTTSHVETSTNSSNTHQIWVTFIIFIGFLAILC